MISMLSMLILLALEILLIQTRLAWNKVLCTVQYFGNYQPWQHLLMHHCTEEDYSVLFCKVSLLSPIR